MLVNVIEFPFTRTQLIHSWEIVVKWISVVNQLSNSMWNTNILKLQVLFYTCRIFFSSFFLHTKAMVFIPTVQLLYIHGWEFFFFFASAVFMFRHCTLYWWSYLPFSVTKNTSYWKHCPLSVFLPGKSHEQRRLGGYSSWGHRVDITE